MPRLDDNHIVDRIVASTGLSWDEAAKEFGCRGHDGAVESIVASTGLSWDEAAKELGCRGHDGVVDSIVASTGLLWNEAKELGCRGHNDAVNSIVALTGLLRDEAAAELGCRGQDVAVDNIVATTGLSRDEAKSELGRRSYEAKEKKYTREEITVMQKCAGKMALDKGRGPKRQNGNIPDWMVVVEVNPRTKIKLSDPGPLCARTENNIAAQLCDWGAMKFGTAQKYIQRFKIGNCNEMTFFVKGAEVRGGGSAAGRLWKLSTHQVKPPCIECVDENMATEMTRAVRDYKNNRNRNNEE